MARGLLRPTFEIACRAEPREVSARLEDALVATGDALEARWARGAMHVIVSPARGRRRPWSAWLHMDVRAAPDADSTILFGRFTPNPTLWTAYMLTLIALLAIALFALALALAQTTLERAPWGWWVLAASVACTGALVSGSLWAQRLASSEMVELRALIERTLAEPPDASV